MSHFKVRENEIVGGGIGCQIQSLQFYPYQVLPQNSGICNCRTGGVIFVQICNISCTCGKSNYIFFLCRFPFPTSRHETMSVWGVGSLFNSCTCSTSHAPAAIWFACFQFSFSMSHFKVRENEIVGGGIGCQIQSLQFYPSQFLPQNSGKCNCRGWGVIFVQICNIPCTCGTYETRRVELKRLNFTTLIPPPTISSFRTLKWDMENKNWKHANQIVAGAWDVEHVHELNKLPTPHTYIFSSFEAGKGKRQRKKM